MTIRELTSTENFFLLAGPCVIEGEDMAMRIAERVLSITADRNIPYVFKGSYRKANRSRLDSFTGIGDENALRVLRRVRETFNIPVVTDIHSAEEAEMAAEYVDILQIPAFLCRQTDLLVAAAKTGRIVNIKKGQFLSPDAMKYAAEKVVSEGGAGNVMLTERGTTFGYQDLVVDFRGIPQKHRIFHGIFEPDIRQAGENQRVHRVGRILGQGQISPPFQIIKDIGHFTSLLSKKIPQICEEFYRFPAGCRICS